MDLAGRPDEGSGRLLHFGRDAVVEVVDGRGGGRGGRGSRHLETGESRTGTGLDGKSSHGSSLR